MNRGFQKTSGYVATFKTLYLKSRPLYSIHTGQAFESILLHSESMGLQELHDNRVVGNEERYSL